MTEREKFEAWANGKLNLTPDTERFDFLYANTQAAWEAWEACAASKQAEIDAANAKIAELTAKSEPVAYKRRFKYDPKSIWEIVLPEARIKRGADGYDWIPLYTTPQVQEGWQPIETAPSFQSVLVFNADKLAFGESATYAIAIKSESPKGDMWLCRFGEIKPSHWMPLPAAPKEK